MAPETLGLEDEFPFGKTYFRVRTASFRDGSKSNIVVKQVSNETATTTINIMCHVKYLQDITNCLALKRESSFEAVRAKLAKHVAKNRRYMDIWDIPWVLTKHCNSGQ